MAKFFGEPYIYAFTQDKDSVRSFVENCFKYAFLFPCLTACVIYCVEIRRVDSIFHGEEVDGFRIYVGKLGDLRLCQHEVACQNTHTCTCKHLRFELLWCGIFHTYLTLSFRNYQKKKKKEVFNN